ncbi:uncharacterized protein LOC117124381 [Anneissia japonica]|uniref:uncharacterized protein LOC117124381 n=1 Tax=Anneissia japonica TaxID=1529436 RepID=UPI001425AE74|nr:uncharacterized protein LOC117124381 [Anneissia japonica]
MELITEEGDRRTAPENQDDNHYQLKEKGENLTCTDTHEVDGDDEIKLLKLTQENAELKIAMREKDASLMLFNGEIKKRDDLIIIKEKKSLRLLNEIHKLEKKVKDILLEKDHINIKLYNSQDNTQYQYKINEGLLGKLKEMKDAGKKKDNDIRELQNLKIRLEETMKELTKDNKKLIRKIKDKDILMRETLADDKKKLKEQNDEIMELNRVQKKKKKKANYLKNELEKCKEENKKLQQSLQIRNNMYLFIILMLLILIFSLILIYPMSTYSWYHPGTIIMMAAIAVMTNKLFINGKNIIIWYNKIVK